MAVMRVRVQQKVGQGTARVRRLALRLRRPGGLALHRGLCEGQGRIQSPAAVLRGHPTVAHSQIKSLIRINQNGIKMAGKPGMKGGGGKREGSGRKVEPVKTLAITIPDGLPGSLVHKDPKIFLLALMNDLEADVKLRADAAKALLPFMHAKIEGGIKDAKQDAAKKAGAGKFGASAPPRLVSSRSA